MSLKAFSEKPSSGWIMAAVVPVVVIIIGIIGGLMAKSSLLFPGGAVLLISILLGALLFAVIIIMAVFVHWGTKVIGVENPKFGRALTLIGLIAVIGLGAQIISVLLAMLLASVAPLMVVVFALMAAGMICISFRLYKNIYGGDWKKAVLVYGGASLFFSFIYIAIMFIVMFIASFGSGSYYSPLNTIGGVTGLGDLQNFEDFDDFDFPMDEIMLEGDNGETSTVGVDEFADFMEQMEEQGFDIDVQ